MDSPLRCPACLPQPPLPALCFRPRLSLSAPLLLIGRPRARGKRAMSVSAQNAPASPSPPRRYAVLRTGHASEYTEKTHGGYGKMLARLLSDGAGETWDIFSVIDGDFSFVERGDGGVAEDGCYYDGYVLTGSAADAHATDVDWINRLCDVLVLLHRRGKKLLGICFGHQILARALGGRTGRAEVGWELGVKTLHIDSDQVSHLYGLALPSTLNAIESHQDQVSAVPPDGIVLASSEKTKIEIFAVGNNALGIQCHPEFSKDVMLDIIQNRVSRKIISDEVAKEATESFAKSQPDQNLLQALCKAFLKGQQ